MFVVNLCSIAECALAFCRVISTTDSAVEPALAPAGHPGSLLASGCRGSLRRSDRRQSTHVAGLLVDKLEAAAQGRSPDSSIVALIPAIRRPKNVSDEDAKSAAKHG